MESESFRRGMLKATEEACRPEAVADVYAAIRRARASTDSAPTTITLGQ